MGSIWRHPVIAILLGFGVISGPGAEPSIGLTTPQITSMSGKAQRLLTDMQKAGESMHLKFAGPSKFSPDWGMIEPDYDGMLSMTGTQIQLGSKAYRFSF